MPRQTERARAFLYQDSLTLSGLAIPIVGAVPYSLGTSASGVAGDLVYLPRSQAITSAHAGKIIIRDVPTVADMPNVVAPPNAYLFQFAKYMSPSLQAEAGLRYERPYLAGEVMHQDLVKAGQVGAAAIVFGFDVPRERVTDYFDPHNGIHYRLPALFLGSIETADLKAAAAGNGSATVAVSAARDTSPTRNLIATLPGESAEKIVFLANTDGNTWVQENGVAGMLALAR